MSARKGRIISSEAAPAAMGSVLKTGCFLEHG